MAAASSEVIALIADMTALLQDDSEDAEQAGQVNLMKQKLAELQQDQVEGAKESIADMHSQIAKLREKVKNPQEVEIALDRERLFQRRQDLEQELQQMLDQLRAHEQQLDEGRQRGDQLQQQYQELAERSQQQIPKLRNLVRLYKKIAPIEWDYDSVDDVKGVIHHLGAREIQNFHLKAEQNLSGAQIADFLWESIESKLL